MFPTTILHVKELAYDTLPHSNGRRPRFRDSSTWLETRGVASVTLWWLSPLVSLPLLCSVVACCWWLVDCALHLLDQHDMAWENWHETRTFHQSGGSILYEALPTLWLELALHTCGWVFCLDFRGIWVILEIASPIPCRQPEILEAHVCPLLHALWGFLKISSSNVCILPPLLGEIEGLGTLSFVLVNGIW